MITNSIFQTCVCLVLFLNFCHACAAPKIVTRKTIGRVHLIEVNMGPVQEIDRWFNRLRSIWDIRLEALDNLLTKEPDND